MQVEYLLLSKNAAPPSQAYEGDAGYDLAATETIVIQPRTLAIVPSGIAFNIPPGYYGQILSRSGLVIAGLEAKGGVIDPSYKAEVKMMLYNRNEGNPITITTGE